MTYEYRVRRDEDNPMHMVTFYVERRLARNGGWYRLCTTNSGADAEDSADALREMQAR